MDHFFLFGLVINLVIGASVIVFFFQTAKFYPYPFLKPVGWHLVLFNAALFIQLLYGYLEVNVPGFASSPQTGLYHDLGYLLTCCLLNGIVFVMGRIYAGFLATRFNAVFVYGMAGGFVLLAVSYIMKKTVGGAITENMFYSLQLFFFMAEILLLILLMAGGKKRGPERKKIIYAFSLINLSHYLVLAVMVLMPLSVVVVSGYLYFNLTPLLWLILFFMKHARAVANQAGSAGVMDSLGKEYRISQREEEIVRLILKGKTNHEIKDELFISYHTVKNHLYSLYGKLGVKSRYELIAFFNRYLADRHNDQVRQDR